MTAGNCNFQQKEHLLISFIFSQAVMHGKYSNSSVWVSFMATSLLLLATLKCWNGTSKFIIRIIKDVYKTNEK